MEDEKGESRRRKPWTEGPERTEGPAAGWLALSDDDLLFRITSLPPGHGQDAVLLEIVRSNRHFFIRQEAAKRIEDMELLKGHSADRHIGQVLVRGMTRREDVDYLEKLAAESCHLEVRKAAEAQLRVVRERVRRSAPQGPEEAEAPPGRRNPA